MIIIGALNSNIIDNFNSFTILSAICNYVLPFPIFIYLMKKIDSQKLEKQSLSIKKFVTYIAITITLMWIGNIIGLAITAAINSFTPFDVINPVQTLINSTDIWLNLFLISIIGPIFEEIFFRKLLIDRTIKYGAKVSILLSALIFGLIHGNLNQFFYAFLLGGFFAYVYIKTGEIKYTITLHIIVNMMGSVVSLFVGKSAQNLISGAIQPLDLATIIIYVLVILISFLIKSGNAFIYRILHFNDDTSNSFLIFGHHQKKELISFREKYQEYITFFNHISALSHPKMINNIL